MPTRVGETEGERKKRREEAQVGFGILQILFHFLSAVFLDVTISILNSNPYTKWLLYKLRKEWICLLKGQAIKILSNTKPNKS